MFHHQLSHRRLDRRRTRPPSRARPGLLGIGGTILLGIVGSLVGGFLGYLIFHKDGEDGLFQPSGLIGSIIGAVIALLVYRRFGSKRRIHA